MGSPGEAAQQTDADGFVLDDLQAELLPDQAAQSERKKHRYIPFIPRAYWFFYRRPIHFLLFVPSLMSSWINTYSLLTMGVILDAIGKPDAMSIIGKRALMNFVFAVVASIMGFFNTYGWAAIGDLIGIKIKRVLFKAMMMKDVEFFDTHTIGDLLTLLTEDVNSMKAAFEFSKAMQVRMIGSLISNIGVSFSIDWRLSLFAVLSTGLAALISRFFRNIGRDMIRLGQKASARSLTVAEEALSNVRVVQSFNRQEREVERYAAEVDEHAYRQGLSRVAFSLGWALSNLLDWGAVCALLNAGCYLVLKGEITAGNLLAVSRTAFSIGSSINMLLGTIATEQKALEAADRIFQIVDLQPSVPPEGGRFLPNFQGLVELRNVWFKYPTRDAWVMKDVSLRIAPGEIAAFVGHSGSGKSTLVQLLLRFYEVTQGQILLDDVDIRAIDPRWLHRNLGVVQQEPILFAVPLRENICYGLPDPSAVDDRELWRVLEATQSSGFVSKLPQQLDTMIGEKGSTLSGGQRQRIAIARTLIRDPRVLITDEATSALDAASEKKVQAALDAVMEGRTSVIIAHRLGTIRAARRIFCFESGVLVEQGTHEELVSREGVYFALVQRQLGAGLRSDSREALADDE